MSLLRAGPHLPIARNQAAPHLLSFGQPTDDCTGIVRSDGGQDFVDYSISKRELERARRSFDRSRIHRHDVRDDGFSDVLRYRLDQVAAPIGAAYRLSLQTVGTGSSDGRAIDRFRSGMVRDFNHWGYLGLGGRMEVRLGPGRKLAAAFETETFGLIEEARVAIDEAVEQIVRFARSCANELVAVLDFGTD
jgi:hypothetical protein